MKEIKEINKKELRKIQINILDKVASFCESQNLRYSLYGGTLLGAIRHNGYIPWDDDIDISMPRPDYERFIENFYLIEDSYLKLHELRLHNYYPYPFIKVSDERTLFIENFNYKYQMGVNIDIFPIDGLPLLEKDSKKIMKKSKFFRGLVDMKRIRISKERAIYKNTLLLFSRIILSIVPINFLLKQIIRLTNKYNYDQSNYIGNIVWGYASKERCNKRVYSDFIFHNFEDKKFKIMIGYDEYLSNVFDEYMQLPPNEKQKAHHSYSAYFK